MNAVRSLVEKAAAACSDWDEQMMRSNWFELECRELRAALPAVEALLKAQEECDHYTGVYYDHKLGQVQMTMGAMRPEVAFDRCPKCGAPLQTDTPLADIRASMQAGHEQDPLQERTR